MALLLDQLADLRRAGTYDKFWGDLSDAAATDITHRLRLEKAALTDLARWEFRGANAELSRRSDAELVLSGPAGTGKSVAVLHRVFDLAVRNPGMRALLVRKTAVSLTSSALVTWREKVIPASLAAGAVTYYGGSAEEPAQYRLWNGSKIMIGGLDNPTKVMSTEYDVAFAQEAIELTESDWESLSSRLRNGMVPAMQLLGDTNPSTPQHWLKERANRGAVVMLESRHEDNPAYYTSDGRITATGAEYMARLDRLTGVRHARLRKGLWVAAEGVIYEDYDPAIHIIPRFDIPADWPRYWSIDFGFTNPFVCGFWAEDPDGRLILYREIYRTQRLIADHCAHILSLVTNERGEWTEPKPQRVVCDHDAEGRAQLRRHLHLPLRPADKSVLTGIEAVARRLRPAGDGRPRLLFMEGALVERDPDLDERKLPCSTVEELPGYVWASTPDGKPNKEEPLKMNDHGVDQVRYLCMDRDERPRARVRYIG